MLAADEPALGSTAPLNHFYNAGTDDHLYDTGVTPPEGYAAAGTMDEQFLLSRERATKVRFYLIKKFTLNPGYVGVMAMGSVVGYGDGVGLVLLKK